MKNSPTFTSSNSEAAASVEYRSAIEEAAIEEGMRLAELHRLSQVLRESGMRLGSLGGDTADHLRELLRPSRLLRSGARPPQ